MNQTFRKRIRKNRGELARLRQDFFSRILADINMPVAENLNPPAVCWLDPQGRINHLRVHAFMQPQAAMPNRPFIQRIFVNHYGLDHSERIARQMGWPLRSGRIDELIQWSFELSLLPNQMTGFAPWIVSLAQAHAANNSAMVIASPHKCHFWNDRNGDILDCRYAWSAAAWRRMKACEKRNEKCAA